MATAGGRLRGADVDAGAVTGVVVGGTVVVAVVVAVVLPDARVVEVLVMGTVDDGTALEPLPDEQAPSMTTAHTATLSRDTLAPMSAVSSVLQIRA
jgi:hypothetical protein